MRHVKLRFNNGPTWIIQGLLYMLLQVLSCNASVLLNTEKRNYFVAHSNYRSSQDEETKASTTSPTSLLPVLDSLGFLPRDDVTGKTNDNVTNYSSKLGGAISNKSLESKIWKALLSKNVNFTRFNWTGVDNSRHELSFDDISSQWAVPHLDRLGFGTSSNIHHGRASSTQDTAPVSVAPHTNTNVSSGKDIKHLVMLGAGSFLGGMSVILSLLLGIFLRRRCALKKARHTDIEATEDDPKLILVNHEVPPATVDGAQDLTVQEYSTSSYASTSSGSAETSSNTSDNVSNGSGTGEVWLSPDQIALSTLEQSVCMKPASLTVSLECSERSTHIRTTPSIVNNVPDLLLPSSIQQRRDDSDGSVGSVEASAKGGTLRCPGTDVMLIVPPGAVCRERSCKVFLKTYNISEFSHVRCSPSEVVISPPIELSSSDVEFFLRPVTINFPYKALTYSGRCLCEDDPLCCCMNNGIELRFCDKPTSEWKNAQCRALDVHYSWPECFSPEPTKANNGHCTGTVDSWVNRTKQTVTYKCSNSSCSIQTNTPGFFCLVWRPQNGTTAEHRRPQNGTTAEHMRPQNGTTAEHRRPQNGTTAEYMTLDRRVTNNRPSPSTNMCATLSAKYQMEKEDREDGTSFKIRQIVYTVYICDNTTSVRQKVEDKIRLSESHQQCDCIPIDVATGSEVKVTLTSVLDPDWPLEIPFDSPSKIVTWKDLCCDFGSLLTCEFRCLPKNDEFPILAGNESDVVSVFDIEILNGKQETPRQGPKKMIGSSLYCHSRLQVGLASH